MHLLESRLAARWETSTKTVQRFVEIAPWITEVRWHPAQKLETLKNGDVVLDLPAGSLIEAKRFILSLGRFGKALGPKELVQGMRDEIREMKKALMGVWTALHKLRKIRP